MQNPSVSILTITQHSRFKSMKILYEIIKRQTYNNIKEWIIVEGSQHFKNAKENKIQLETFFTESTLLYPIKYIEYSEKKLGGLRNLGNDNCSGDIIICFDDDDYSPPERISHTVEKLSESEYLIGGVSDIYMYDFYFDQLFRFKYKIPNHSTNNCMAYKKEYLQENRYDDNCCCGEEKEFTKDFTNPMIAFDSEKILIAISHSKNTYDKHNLCIDALSKKNNYMKKVYKNIHHFIPIEIFQKMKFIYQTLEKPEINTYIDI
jgi:glycosyltransferase involved in cell wall biosynthesis